MDTQGTSKIRFPRTGKLKRKGPGESQESGTITQGENAVTIEPYAVLKKTLQRRSW